MSKYIPGNQKHLTLEDRVFIEISLNQKIIVVVIFLQVVYVPLLA